MQASETAKPAGTDSGALQVGQNDCAGIADYDVLYIATAVYKDSNLSIDFARYLGKMAREFLGNDFVGRNTPLIKLLQAVDLAWFQALQVTFDTYGYLLRAKAVDQYMILHQDGDRCTAFALD